MRVVIMQPTYLPWLGHFDLMDQADCFVILDNVQLEKQSWQQRNRIKTRRGAGWLTVPIVRRFPQLISVAEVNHQTGWSENHWRTIEQNYHRALYWEGYAAELESIITRRWYLLIDLNLALIDWLKRILGLSTPLLRASALSLQGSRSHLLVSICRHLGADVYLSPLGSANYLRQDAAFEPAGIRLELQHYEHPTYRQLYPPFVPYLSVLDLIMNEGEAALDIIRSGRREPYTLENVPVAHAETLTTGLMDAGGISG